MDWSQHVPFAAALSYATLSFKMIAPFFSITLYASFLVSSMSVVCASFALCILFAHVPLFLNMKIAIPISTHVHITISPSIPTITVINAHIGGARLVLELIGA